MTGDDTDSFNVNCQAVAIGSSIRGIRSVLTRLKQGSELATIYARFENVTPDLANLDLSKGCRQLYDEKTRCLIVTIPGKPHEAVLWQTQLQLAQVVSPPQCISSGAGRVEGFLTSKEPDAAWIPRVLPANRDRTWPTLVLEVGMSETKSKLRADAAWWLSNSEGLVNMVITISIHKTVPEVTFESIVLQRPIHQLRNMGIYLQGWGEPHTQQIHLYICR